MRPKAARDKSSHRSLGSAESKYALYIGGGVLYIALPLALLLLPVIVLSIMPLLLLLNALLGPLLVPPLYCISL
jgi:hypothetical protein